MKGLLVKGFVVVALGAAILVPAAAATSSPRVNLALVPLQKAQLGSVAKSLALAQGSGVVSNARDSEDTLGGVSPKFFTKLGRVSGYALVYGDQASGRSGVDSVWNSVDEYKTPADAKKALAFWQKDDAKIVQLNQGGFGVKAKAIKVPAVGTRRFASVASYHASNIAALSSVDEQLTDGNYLLDVTVSAGTTAQAKTLAEQYAKKLDQRLQLALAGKLHAKKVKLPAKAKAGAPKGGPDLSTLALETSDMTGTATLVGEGYTVDTAAVSDYSVVMYPAGQFDFLSQDIEWYPSANDASFWADWANADLLADKGSAIDLSSVGHGGQATIVHGPQGDSAQAILSVGDLSEYIFVGSTSTIQASDVQNIAQTAANKLDAAGISG